MGDFRTSSGGSGGGLRLLAIRTLNYVTNRIVAHVPSYTVRNRWYRQKLSTSWIVRFND
jgi:hypothetical protein